MLAALRSPGFGCGDDDLLRHRLAGGGWDYRVAGAAGTAPVAAGLRALPDLHADRWWLEVSELVGPVVDERRLLPLALDGPRWREAWRRLRFVLDQARQFTEALGGRPPGVPGVGRRPAGRGRPGRPRWCCPRATSTPSG